MGEQERDKPHLDVEVEIEDEEIDLSDVRAMDYLVLVIFWVLAFVVFLQFFTRYVLNDSLGWTEEIARFLLIAVTFTGSIMGARKVSHIAVEVLYRIVPRPLRRAAQLVIDLLSTLFYALLGGLCVQLAGRTYQMMVSIDLPKSIVYYYVAACFFGMALFAAWNTVVHLRSGTSRIIDPESGAEATRAMD